MGDPLSLYLADACALIEFYLDSPTLPEGVAGLIEEETDRVAISAATIWEIAIKTALGKLDPICDPAYPSLSEMFQAQGYALLALDGATAEQAAALPRLHADPFDRALVATAQRTGRTILTNDRAIERYAVPTLWH